MNAHKHCFSLLSTDLYLYGSSGSPRVSSGKQEGWFDPLNGSPDPVSGSPSSTLGRVVPRGALVRAAV